MVKKIILATSVPFALSSLLDVESISKALLAADKIRSSGGYA